MESKVETTTTSSYHSSYSSTSQSPGRREIEANREEIEKLKRSRGVFTPYEGSGESDTTGE